MKKAPRKNVRKKCDTNLTMVMDEVEDCSMTIRMIAELLSRCESPVPSQTVIDAGHFIIGEMNRLNAALTPVLRKIASTD